MAKLALTAREVADLKAREKDAHDNIREAEEQKMKSALDGKLMAIGNILHEYMPVAADEATNVPLRVF